MRVQLADGLTKSSAGIFLRSAIISGTAQLHEESTKVSRRTQTPNSSKEVQGVSAANMDLERINLATRQPSKSATKPKPHASHEASDHSTVTPKFLFFALPFLVWRCFGGRALGL